MSYLCDLDAYARAPNNRLESTRSTPSLDLSLRDHINEKTTNPKLAIA